MKNSWVLIIAALLVAIGIFKPDLGSLVIKPNNPAIDVETITIPAPTSESLKVKADDVVKALLVNSDRKGDGQRLGSLYNDLSTLVALDGDDGVIKNTEEVRQANRLAGLMLRLDIKGKYPDLAAATNNLLVGSIGDDIILLNSELRTKTVDAFKALAWACYEGSK